MAKEKKVRDNSRKWLLTINNPSEHGMEHEQIKSILDDIENLSYWCMCDEIGGTTNCYHTHLFLYRSSSGIRFDFLKKRFPSAHFDFPFGTSEQNRNYIRKEGDYLNSEKAVTNLKDTFEEFGECPVEQQGKRNDLSHMYNLIKDGCSNFEIIEENPNFLKRLDLMDKTRELLRYEEFRNKLRNVHVEYWSGDSGSGKTSGVMQMYGDYNNVYRVINYHNPWDGYKGQDVVLFDDFIGYQCNINELLSWLDVYPLELRCRYYNKQACFSKIYIVSSIPLDRQYTDIQKYDNQIWQGFCS